MLLFISRTFWVKGAIETFELSLSIADSIFFKEFWISFKTALFVIVRLFNSFIFSSISEVVLGSKEFAASESNFPINDLFNLMSFIKSR